MKTAACVCLVAFLWLGISSIASADSITITATGTVVASTADAGGPPLFPTVPISPGDPFYVMVNLLPGLNGSTVTWSYTNHTGCFPSAPTCTFTTRIQGVFIDDDQLTFEAGNRPIPFGFMDVDFLYPAGTFGGLTCDLCTPGTLAAALRGPTVNLSTAIAGRLDVEEEIGLLFGVINPNSVAVTPEPASWVLLGTGLAGLLAVRRFRKPIH